MGTVSYMYKRKIVVQTQVRVSFFIREFIHSSIFMHSFIHLYSSIHSAFNIHEFIHKRLSTSKTLFDIKCFAI